MADLVLIRHGQTEWSATGRHTSYTDVDLTGIGEAQARKLAPALAVRHIAAVITSPRTRARRTAELAGLAVPEVDPDLAEWNYGDYEGITTEQVRIDRPDWTLWTDGAPGGESPDDIGVRVDRLLRRLRPYLAGDGDVVLVGHGHCLRVLAARWIGLSPAHGGLFYLDTATVSVLGHEHDRHVVLRWNVDA